MKGMAQLNAAMRSRMRCEAVKMIVKQNGAELEERMKNRTEVAFTKGYSVPPHQTRQSIHTTIENNGLTAVVGPTTQYAPYVEFGTRKMEAEPFVFPSWAEQADQFKKDLRRITR